MAKIIWVYRYVQDGQLEPDKHGRWALNGYVEVPTTAIQGYQAFETIMVPICNIVQKNTSNGVVPSLIDRFACKMSVAEDANIGFGEKYMFSNDLEDLKSQIEIAFNKTVEVFKHAL